MNKFDILLDALEITARDEYADAQIAHVSVNLDNEFTITIHSTYALNYKAANRLREQSYLFAYPLTLVFDFESIDQETINDYATHIFASLKAANPGFSNLDESCMSYEDGKIIFNVINELQEMHMAALLEDIESYFDEFGIDVECLVKIDEDNKQYMETLDAIDDVLKPVYVEKEVIEQLHESRRQSENQEKRYSYKHDYFKTKIKDIEPDMGDVVIEGYCFFEETIEKRDKKLIQSFYVTDFEDSIICKRREYGRVTREELERLKGGKKWVRVSGRLENDRYESETVINCRKVEIIPPLEKHEDKAEAKRVELNVHSTMSTLDGTNAIGDFVAQAAKWGHKAIAITDTGNVHAFPDAESAAKKAGIKMLYGVQLDMVDTEFPVVHNLKSCPLADMTFISFDLETTGLSCLDDYITEFGAIKIQNGIEVGRLQTFIHSPKPISPAISQMTNITNEDIRNAPTIEEFMPKILDFFGDDILVAHNAVFDIGMLNQALKRMGQEPIKNTWIDSLPLARYLIPLQRSYRLGAVCSHYKIPYDSEEAHRADYDAEVLSQAFNAMLIQMLKKGVDNIDQIPQMHLSDAHKHAHGFPVTIFAKNAEGLKEVFKIVSLANTTYLYLGARIPRSYLKEHRDNLLIGCGGLNSKVFDLAATKTEEELFDEMSFYDYIEIHPLDQAQYLVDRNRYDSIDDIQHLYQRIIKVAKKAKKLIVATGEVHYLEKHDKVYRNVFITNEKLTINGRPHPLLNRRDPRASTPDVYLRTTQEMMESFPYIDHDELFDYVVTNTNKIADMTDDIGVIKKGLYPPKIDNVDKLLTDICYGNAHKQYGDPLPEYVAQRLNHELSNIIKHGYAVIYYIASLLVKQSNDDGYLVGSRGSVGSSFVATMSGISEVNPLKPHYYCPHCQHSEFFDDPEIASGYDLPDKLCPVCGKPMKGDGQNIPFETFLGFNADKVPDIDLNFSGAYQAKAHDFTKKIFGVDHVFRAGTISTVADKTAFGYAKGYAERLGIDNTISKAELTRLAMGCTGVKRTTGQHPGGIIVIPDHMTVYDFTPYQYPADDVEATWYTTHFDFHKIHDNVLKFDILGHVDPTVIRMLQDLTGVDPHTIPTNDKAVMSLFTSTKAMGIDLSFINCNNGALGLPEFGTPFVRGMLDATKPTNYADLVIISGLSHGTDVYLGNAETLIKTGTCTLKEVIGCRDDIMVYLIDKGLENKDAFDIMECVRKGQSKRVFPERGYVEIMKQHQVPQWYIDSCFKIKYMFPKAHAAAYVLSAIRVAWWKLYYPREYYAVYFSTRCDSYEINTLLSGKEAVLNRYLELLKLRANKQAVKKDEDLITVFEIALEMFERGYHFSNISLELSEVTNFILDPNDDKGIIPSFCSIDGLGTAAGESVVIARKDHQFTSVEDVSKRTKLSNTHIEKMAQLGVMEHLSERDQLSFFDLFDDLLN